jgi:hypothetical protein
MQTKALYEGVGSRAEGLVIPVTIQVLLVTAVLVLSFAA